jgi:hypothetical protein
VGQATSEKKEIAVKETEEGENEAKDKASLITVSGTYLITYAV